MSGRETTFARQWRIIQLLGKSSEGLTLEELVIGTGYNRRTIQRHFAQFRENGVPLVEEKEKETGLKFYRIVLNDPKTAFTLDELIAVYTARRFLEPMMGTFLWDAMQQAIDKMRKNLGSQLIRYLERNLTLFEKTKFGWSDYRDRCGLVDELIGAIENRNRAVLLYRSVTDEEAKPVKVSPYGLVHHDGSLYLVGHSHKRDAIRHWKVDRMYGITVTHEKFNPPVDFTLSEHLSGAFGIFEDKADGKTYRVKIRFDQFFAGQIREKHWHESERFTPQPDGGMLLELRVKELAMLKRWILGFGRHAKVLAPKELTNMLKKEIADLDGIYR